MNLHIKPGAVDDTKTWIGFDNKELITMWHALLDRKKALEADVRKVLYKADRDYMQTLDEARVQADMFTELAEASLMLAELSVALEEWGIKAP